MIGQSALMTQHIFLQTQVGHHRPTEIDGRRSLLGMSDFGHFDALFLSIALFGWVVVP